MEYQEKRTLANLIATTILFTVYYLYVYGQYQELGIANGTDLTFWAKYILILVPYMIGFKIIVHILITIVTAIATREEPQDMEDEMDKLIDMKASRNGSIVFMLGFMLAMGALVMGYSAHTMFIIIMGSLMASGIFGEASMFYYYRRGV